MKDSWSLLEDSLLGNKQSYLKLMQEAIPSLFVYFFTIYGNNRKLAIDESNFALENSFTQLNHRKQNKNFLEWVLGDLVIIKKQNLISDLKEEVNLKKFTEIYIKEINTCRFTFEFFQPSHFLKEDIDRAKSLIESSNEYLANDLENCVKEISDTYKPSSLLSFYVKKNIYIYLCVLASSFLIISAFYYWQGRYPKNQKVDFSQLKQIQPPLSVIFEDIYGKQVSWEDDPIYEMPENKEEVIIIDRKHKDAIATPLELQVKIQTIEPEEAKVEAKQEPKIEPNEEIKKEKQVEVKLEEVKKEEEKKPNLVEIKKEIPSVEKEVEKKETEIPEETDDPTIEQEIVVLNQKEIPLIPKDLTKTEEGAIQIGDDKEKYELKDYKDKKVIFYSFLEVKDVEKAKVEAFKILAKFGYKGEVLKREKDYIVLTATFPGKENHDRMIKKFNGLGTLYVGNDVSEFLELYKKELDKERSFFFPKYKPEDLPKEVTVNLYVFPLQKK